MRSSFSLAVGSLESLTFHQLIAPQDPGEFLARVLGVRAVHVEGDKSKFAPLFSWEQCNRLLAMATGLSADAIQIFDDGRQLANDEICNTHNAGEAPSPNHPDGARLTALLAGGATLMLHDVQRLAPGLSAITDACQIAIGGAIRISAVLGVSGSPGLPSRFETNDILVTQIEGARSWRLFQGTYDDPADFDRQCYEDLDPRTHSRRLGAVAEEFMLDAGDLLHVPRGQYFEALEASSNSLHLVFAIQRFTALDLLRLMREPLSASPLFRRELPHIDDESGTQSHLENLLEHMASLLEDPGASRQVRAIQRTAAMRGLPVSLALPEGSRISRLRVCSRVARLESTDGGVSLRVGGAVASLTAPESEIAAWILERDLIDDRALLNEFGRLGTGVIEQTVQKLIDLCVVEPL